MIKNICLTLTAIGGALLLWTMIQRVDNSGFDNLTHEGVIQGLLLLAIALRITLK